MAAVSESPCRGARVFRVFALPVFGPSQLGSIRTLERGELYTSPATSVNQDEHIMWQSRRAIKALASGHTFPLLSFPHVPVYQRLLHLHVRQVATFNVTEGTCYVPDTCCP